MFQKFGRENQKTHFRFSNFSQISWHLGDNVEKFGRAGQATDGNIIRSMRFACRINKATDKHSEYVYLLLFHGNDSYAKTPQYYVRTYVYIACVLFVALPKPLMLHSC
jgi:hypothetical protein